MERGTRAQLGLTVAAAVVLALLVAHTGPPVAGQAWSVGIIDQGDIFTGYAPSMALDSLGRPHIAYGGSVNGTPALLYVHWTGSAWAFQTVDLGVWPSLGVSLAVDSNGTPHIAYRDEANMDLKYAAKSNGSWTVETVDSFGDVGLHASLAVDSLGRPHIAYHNLSANATSFAVKYAVGGPAGWGIETLWDMPWAYDGDKGISLVLDASDRPQIAFTDSPTAGGLMYGFFDGSSWQLEVVESIPGKSAGALPSLALDAMGVPHISYQRLTGDTGLDNEQLRHAVRGPTGWTTEWVGDARTTYSSIAVDSLGRPRIAYVAPRGQPPPVSSYLYFAEQTGAWSFETVDWREIVWNPLSIAVDGCDGTHIAYQRYVPSMNWSSLGYAYRPGIDATPPTSRPSVSGAYWRNAAPITVAAVTSDACSPLADVTLWYRYGPDNATWGAWTPFQTLASPPWTWSFPFPDGAGYYEFYTTATDASGNAELPPTTADAVAGYDPMPPVSTATPIVPYWHAAPPLTVDATASDALSGVADVTLMYVFSSDNATWGPWTPWGALATPPWSWSFPFPDGEGHYRFHTVARDVAGNVEASKAVAEAIAAYGALPDYTPENPVPSGPVTVGFSQPLTLSVDVANLGGRANATVMLVFFNTSTPSSPFAQVSVPPVTAGGRSGPFVVAWMSPAVPCGCGVVAAVDRDNALAESNETNNEYTWAISVVPGPITYLVVGQPNVTAAVPYVTSSTPLSYSVLDQGGTGIRRTMYRIDGGAWVDYGATGPFTLAQEGEHAIEWFSEDNAGNVESPRSGVARVDNTPPVTSAIVGAPKHQASQLFVTSTTPIHLKATDGGTVPVGLREIEYRFGGGSWTRYTAPFTLPGPDGARTVTYRGTDLLGNVEAPQFLDVVLDDTPPVTAIEPGSTTVAEGTRFAMPATDEGSGVAGTEYRIDGGPWNAYEGPFVIAPGDHDIAYRSRDNLGNEEVPKSVRVSVLGAPSEANYKPLVAAVFAILLVVVAAWSARRTSRSEPRRAWKAFAASGLPFVLAEAATGILSFFTGLLAIPPIVGWGSVVDLAILVAGVTLAIVHARRVEVSGPRTRAT